MNHMNYKKLATSAEVWAVIRARHYNDLGVFSSYSAPEGDYFGNPQLGVMATEYGLNGAGCPLLGARTTWDVGPVAHERKNEKTEYWLCYPIEDES